MMRDGKRRFLRPVLTAAGSLKAAALAALCGVLLLFCSGPEAVYGAEIRKEEGRAVYDYAELFDEDQVRQLEDQAARVKQDVKFDVVIMTTLDAEGKESQAYADDAYDAGGFGVGSDHDGILYLIDLDNRELTFSTAGTAIRIFSYERVETMLDHVYEYVSDGDYAESAAVFLKDVQTYAAEGILSGQYNYDTETGRISVHRSIRWYEMLLAAAVSAIVAGGAAAAVKRQYRMETDERQLANANMVYRADSQFEFSDKNDVLIDTFVVTSLIAAGAAAAAGRGNSGRRGGMGPRSSPTHHSSGGRVHGGGSRRF